MKLSNYTCSKCQKVLFITDNMITATITTDFINKAHEYETGKTTLKIHWCELCASDISNLTIEKKNEHTK